MFQGAEAKLAKRGPRKLLALDGGGIRGLISIEILARIEEIVRRQSGQPNAVLADYFDYIAGTSTGAVIGTLVSLGKTVDEIRQIYLQCGPMMFDRNAIVGRLQKLGKDVPFGEKLLKAADVGLHYAKRWAGEREAYAKYPDEALAAKLKELVGGGDVALGSDTLKTLLLLVLSNATTDSTWPLSNNPRARYNDASLPECNARFPLWQVVRASTAAPTYFPPQEIRVGNETMVFVDGGVTSYNNPAFALFLHATLEPYRVMWPTGEKQMLIVSIGTGLHPNERAGLRSSDLHALAAASGATKALFNAALYQQDQLCRVFGRCLSGEELDRELGDLMRAGGPADPERMFTYVRYNACLTTEGLRELGITGIDPASVQLLDATDHMPELQTIGRTVADRHVQPAVFEPFPL